MSQDKQDALLELNNPARVIQLNNNRFSAGLMWQPLASPASMKEEVVQFAKNEQMNLAVIYSGQAVQAGFIAAPGSQVKLYANTYSLASVLAETLGDSWLGVWEVDQDTWVMIAVYDGVIVPGCDVIGSREFIESNLIDISGAHPWERVYLSDNALSAYLVDSFGFEDTQLSDLLKSKKYKRAHKIYEVREGLPKIAVLGLVAAVALGMVAFGFNWYKGNAVEAQKLKRELISKANKIKKVEDDKAYWQQKVREATPEPPWDKQPLANQVIDDCTQAFNSLHLSLAGWTFTGAKCASGKLSVSYAYAGGTSMADFYRAAEYLREQGIAKDFTVLPTEGSVVYALPDRPIRVQQTPLEFSAWSIGWLSHFQMLKMDSRLTLVPPVKRGPVSPQAVDVLGAEAATPAPPWWQNYSWSFESRGIDVMGVLKHLPEEGFVIEELSIDVRDGGAWQWKASGNIYTK